MPSKNTIIIILGMHRSGTSLIARCLEILDFFPGNSLLPGQSDNLDGFWEPAEAVRINNDIFAHFFSSWDNPSSLPRNWWNRPTVKKFENQIENFLKSNYHDKKVSILKDPRLTILFPLWKKVLNKLNWDIKFIIPYRSPKDVSMSLKKRNKFDEFHSSFMWMNAIINAERFSRYYQRYFLSYDDLLTNHELQLKKLLKTFKLNTNKLSKSKLDLIKSFINVDKKNEVKVNIYKKSNSEINIYNLKDYIYADLINFSALKINHKELVRLFNKHKKNFDVIDKCINSLIKKTSSTKDYYIDELLKMNIENENMINQLQFENDKLQPNVLENIQKLKLKLKQFLFFCIRLVYPLLTWFTTPGFRRKIILRAINYFPVFKDINTPLINLLTDKHNISHNSIFINNNKTLLKDKLVSVIIPVFNKWDLTEKCLESIFKNKPLCSFEIILIDDASTELETKNNISKYINIKYIRNDQNLGFIKSCNKASLLAQGEFLFFLNNDTQLVNGSIDELILTLINNPNAGICGSKLIYSDGVLQEAGGIIWNDGSAWNYGKYDNAKNPEFNYMRQVDYVSGAALMISKELFHKLGQFNMDYCPAYCEDSDLCLRVRSSGFDVLYQPRSIVIHYEGASLGVDENKGIKSFQPVNQKKLFHRWKNVLHSHGVNGENPYLERDRVFNKRILIMDSITPRPTIDAGSLTAFNLMKILLKDDHRVTFIPSNLLYDNEFTENLQRMGVECIYLPFNINSYLSMYGRYFDFVILNRVENAFVHLNNVRKYCSKAKFIFNTVDLHFLREEREAKIEKSLFKELKAKITKHKEIKIINSTDATIVLSSFEKNLLAKFTTSKIFTLPLILEVEEVINSFKERKDILFIGGFQHKPNIDAVNYFINEIWPLIFNSRPDLRFKIIGSNMPSEFKNIKIKGVEPVGFVEDLSPLLNNSILSISPLRYGAGIKGKIGTSLSHGLPVVATKISAEGMELADGTNILIANDSIDFANKVIKLSSDEKLWNKLSAHGVNFVKKNYSFDVIDKKIKKILRST